MKKSKIILIVFFSVLLLLFGFNAVKAEETMTDEECKACAERNGGRCGYCKACALVNGECVVNQHDKELWDEAKCADDAKTKKECNKCDGYVWSSSASKCVTPASLKSEESNNNQSSTNNQNTATTTSSKEDPDKEYELENQIEKTSCGTGKGKVSGIPKKLPELTSFIVTVVQIAVPVILVIMGTLDLFKGITAGKEDEMKKGQQMFIKRLAIAAIIFFVVIIVKFLISIVADTNQTNIGKCIDCFVSNDCEEE